MLLPIKKPEKSPANRSAWSVLRLSPAPTILLMICLADGGSIASAADVETETAASSGNLATSVAAPTYGPGSVQLAQFNELNAVRRAGNFGMLAQDPLLDLSSTNHARYLIANYYTAATGWNSSALTQRDQSTSYLASHVEYSNLPGFKGTLPGDRVSAVGGSYAGVGEVVAPQSIDCVGKLLDSVFHRAGLLLTDMQYVGIDIVTTPGNDSNICVIDMGYKDYPSTVPGGWVGLYPTNGQTNVPTGMFSAEAPDPAPGVPVIARGYPISIFSDQAIRSVKSFTLTATGAQLTVPTILITNASFPGFLNERSVFILPTQLLASNTTYIAQFSGELADGSTLTKTWSFTTTTIQPITISFSPGSLDGVGSAITATASGAQRFDSLWIGAYTTYDAYPGAAATPTFITTAYTNASVGFHAITITRTNTPCAGHFVNCSVVVFAQDLLGNRVQTTVPFK